MTPTVLSLKALKTGLIYRNPKPHVKSIHAYFPSVALLPNNELLATFALGEAFESANNHTHLARSSDNGESWRLEGPVYRGTKDRLTSDYARLTALPDGEAVIFMMRSDRTAHPDDGLSNEKTLGFVPTELLLLRSSDGGRTWSRPAPLAPPLVGPSFELCCPIVPLRSSRWILPTATWPGWDGDCPNGIKMVALVSDDRGHSWPRYWNVMQEPKGRVFFWESKIVELPDNRLLAVAWAYDDKAKKDRPNQYAISADGGATWQAPRSTGLWGQTLTPIVLKDGRILCVYRRMDKTGLWVNVSRLEKDKWINEAEAPLWGHGAANLTAATKNMSHNFNVLRFGAPCIVRLPDGALFVAFWGYEDCVSNIRWFKFKI